MSVRSLPRLHIPKDIRPDKQEVTGFLGTALILAALFVWS